eukprot:23777_1
MIVSLLVLSSFYAIATGDAIIGNGDVILGVDDAGNLNVPYRQVDALNLPATNPNKASYVGLRNGGDLGEAGVYASTEAGCLCEGWGVGVTTGSGNFDAYADISVGGFSLNQIDFVGVDGGTTATSKIGDVTGRFEVIHDFYPSPDTDYAFEAEITITNVGSEDFSQTLYRRVMDWDISPTEFSEYVTIQGTAATSLIYSSDNGFCHPSPFQTCTERAAGTTDVDFEDSGPIDHGAVFDFSLGALAQGESVTFYIYYGVGPGEVAVELALVAIEAEVASWAHNAGDPVTGFPYTFFFAFTAVGGDPIQPLEVVDVDCSTVQGLGVVYPEISSAECADGYMLVGCNSFGTHPHEIYGSWIEDDVCYSTGGQAVSTPTYAEARCCALPECSSCSSVTTSGDGIATSSCPDDEELTGCAANTNDDHDTYRFRVGAAGVDSTGTGFEDTSGITLETPTATENTCSASGFNVDTGNAGYDYLEAVSACCYVPDNYELSCYSEWKEQGGGSSSLNTASWMSCPDDYFMTSCVGRNNYYERTGGEWAIDYYYITDDDKCATQMNNYQDLYAQMTCCQLKKSGDDIDCEDCDEYVYIDDGVDRTYEEAQAFCESSEGTSLATITTEAQMECALAEIGDGPSPWIGLNSLDNNHGRYTFDDCTDCPEEDNGVYSGACLSKRLWCDNIPIDCDEGSQCVRVSSDDGGCVINDEECEDTLPAILCNKEVTSECPLECIEHGDTSCPPETSIDREYVLPLDNGGIAVTEYSYDNADTYCALRYGTGLSTVITSTEATNIAALAATNNSPIGWYSFFIGLNDRDVEGDFVWLDGSCCAITDGSGLCSSLWKSGEPNTDGDNSEDCVSVIISGGSGSMKRDLSCPVSTLVVCNAPCDGTDNGHVAVSSAMTAIENRLGNPNRVNPSSSFFNNKNNVAIIGFMLLGAFLVFLLINNTSFFFI